MNMLFDPLGPRAAPRTPEDDGRRVDDQKEARCTACRKCGAIRKLAAEAAFAAASQERYSQSQAMPPALQAGA